MWRHLVGKLPIYWNGAIWWLNFELHKLFVSLRHLMAKYLITQTVCFLSIGLDYDLKVDCIKKSVNCTKGDVIPNKKGNCVANFTVKGWTTQELS